jgi:predicted SnoaL-like aldol condensation-catalyzing enzyme
MQLTPEEITLITRTRELRPLIEDFVRLAYVEGQRKEAFEKYVAEDLIEHNPDFCDGRESSAKYIAARFAGMNPRDYVPASEWKVVLDLTVIHGDLLIMRKHAFQRRDDSGRVFIDFWRWQGRHIVEHWDALQDVPNNKISPRPMW